MKWECFLFRWERRLENDCESNCLRCIFPLMSIHEPERENTSFSCSPLTLLWRLCLTFNYFPKVELSMRRRWDVFAGPADSEDTLAQVAAREWSSTHYWRFAGPIRPAACFCAFRIFVFSRILKVGPIIGGYTQHTRLHNSLSAHIILLYKQFEIIDVISLMIFLIVL